MEIPTQIFIKHDLREPLQLNKKFDLSLCLEVAEHLPNESADDLVDLLTNNSKHILFSAALPLQGGQAHINEQPFEYWVKKFNNKGFVVKDIFRERIWDDENIDWWYRQNIFLISKDDVLSQKKINDYYHPGKIKYTDNENSAFIDQLNNKTDQLNNKINDLSTELLDLYNFKYEIITGRISPYKGLKLFGKSIINFIKRSKH